MDDLPSEKNQSQPQGQTEGEIFSSPDQSGYQATTSTDQQSSPDQEQYQVDQPAYPQTPEAESSENQLNQPEDSISPPIDTGISTPPPFAENKFKKYIVFLFAFIILAIVVLGLFSLLRNFLFKSKPKPPTLVSLTYWGLWEEKEIIQPVIDEYKRKNPNITVNYIKQDPKQYRERLQAAISRGEGPDIFRFHNTWVPMLTNELSPMPKDIYSNDEFAKTFYPVVSLDLKIGDNYYGIPLMIDGLMLFYNEDILNSANITVPSTWEDVQNIMQKRIFAKENGKILTAFIALGTTDNLEHFSDILALMMLQNGVKLNQSLFSCSDNTNTTCAVEALSFYHKFAEQPDNVWDETLENSITAFAGGKVAIIFAPTWQAHVLQQMNPNLNFKIATVPQLPCAKQPCTAINWATYWVEGISSKSKNTKAAWEFLKYLSQPETMQKLYAEEVKYRKLFGEPYSRVDLGKTLADNPYLAPLITSAPFMKSFYLASRTYDGDTGIDSSLIKYLKDAVNSLSQGVSPETALQTANNGFKQVFSRFNIATSPL